MAETHSLTSGPNDGTPGLPGFNKYIYNINTINIDNILIENHNFFNTTVDSSETNTRSHGH